MKIKQVKKWRQDDILFVNQLKSIFKKIDNCLVEEFPTNELAFKKETQERYIVRATEIFKQCGYKWDSNPQFSFVWLNKLCGGGLAIIVYIKDRKGFLLKINI